MTSLGGRQEKEINYTNLITVLKNVQTLNLTEEVYNKNHFPQILR